MKKLHNLKAILLICGLSLWGFSESDAQQQFQRTYGGPGEEQARQVIELANGNFVVLGETSSYGAGGSDVYFMETNSTGVPIWAEHYGSAANERGWSFVETPPNIGGQPGYFISVLQNVGTGGGGQDFEMLRVDQLGALQCAEDYGRGTNEYGRLIRVGVGNRLRLMGYTGTGFGGNDFGMMSANPFNCTPAAQLQSIGGNANDFPHHFIVSQFGGTNYEMICGYRRNYTGNTDFNGYLVQLNANGTLGPTTIYDESAGATNESFSSMVEITGSTGAPEWVMAGFTSWSANATFGANNFLFVHTDNAGNVINSRIIGTNANEQYRHILSIPTGFVMVGTTTFTTSTGNVQSDIVAMETDFFGNVVWSRSYGGAGNETINGSGTSIFQTADGGYVISGTSNSFSTGDNDMFLIKTNASGVAVTDPLCERPYPVNSAAIQLNVTSDGGIQLNPLLNSVITPAQNTQIPPSQAQCVSPCQVYIDSGYIDPPNLSITTDEVWTGTFHFSPGTIVTVSQGATLDLTNVDIVFENCSGIDFTDGAILRANNSVFRTCDPTESWRGFDFTDGASGEINECTFKNAQYALNFNGTPPAPAQPNPADANVVNNLFSNCFTGINIEADVFDEAITGNTFQIDDDVATINYTGACNTIGNTQFFGITGLTSAINRDIAQNDFHNGLADGAVEQFFGVTLLGCSGALSANNFTDCFRAIDIGTGSNNVLIENNEIEVTLNFSTEEYQIRVSQASNVWVSGNTIVDNFEHPFFNTLSSAIYIDQSQGVDVKENLVRGFANGISALNLTDGFISENEVMNTNIVGVRIVNGFNVNIACNTINMDFDQAAANVGILMQQTNAGAVQNHQIRGNCISEANYSILTFGVNGSALPLIKNNYLYNYITAGVFNLGYTGNIGTGVGSFAVAGRNSFTSNNIPNGAVDVFSSTPMTAAGNYGISTVNVNVTVLGNNLYNSTATCGNQIGTVSSEIGAEELCDGFFTNLANIIGSGGNDQFALQGDYVTKFAAVSQDRRLAQGKYLMSLLSQNSNDNALDQFYSDVLNANAFEGNDALWFSYEYQMIKRQFNDAASVLAGIQPTSTNEEELITVEDIRLTWVNEGRKPSQLTLDEKETLLAIDQRMGRNADIARDLLHISVGAHNYRFKEAVEVPKSVEGDLITVGLEMLEVYPNPTSGYLTITYASNNVESSYLMVHDVQGKLVMETPVIYDAQQQTIDVSMLNEGMYVLSIQDENGVSNYARFIVTK